MSVAEERRVTALTLLVEASHRITIDPLRWLKAFEEFLSAEDVRELTYRTDVLRLAVRRSGPQVSVEHVVGSARNMLAYVLNPAPTRPVRSLSTKKGTRKKTR